MWKEIFIPLSPQKIIENHIAFASGKSLGEEKFAH
jgi:hypothetical protein